MLKDSQGESNGVLLNAADDSVFDLVYSDTPKMAELNYRALRDGLDEAER